MSKFTPGPWRLAALSKSYGIYENDGTRVAEVGGAFGVARERRESDARLIASAPDLYEALRSLLNDCLKLDDGACNDAILDQAIIALAKAEGKA